MKITNKRRDESSTEAIIKIAFDPENTYEKYFMDSLVESFSEERRKQYVTNGHFSALLDFSREKNVITLTGCGEHINHHLHSPPLELPRSQEGFEDGKFWAVGDEIYSKGEVQEYRNLGEVVSPDHEAIKKQIDEIRAAINRRNTIRKLCGFMVEGEDYRDWGVEHVFFSITGTFHHKSLFRELLDFTASQVAEVLEWPKGDAANAEKFKTFQNNIEKLLTAAPGKSAVVTSVALRRDTEQDRLGGGAGGSGR